MKLPILILAAAIPAAHAATLAVLPGESIQAKIDAAASKLCIFALLITVISGRGALS